MSILRRCVHGMCATCTVIYYTLTYLYVHPTKTSARYVCYMYCYVLHTDILICPSYKDVCTVCVLHVQLFITHWHTYMSILQRRLHGMCATCTVMYYTLAYLYVHPTKTSARYVCYMYCYVLHTGILICPSYKDVCTVCVLHVQLFITHWHTYMSILRRCLHGMCAICTVIYYTLTYLYVHPTKMSARYVCHLYCYLLHTDILICPSYKDVCTVCVLHVLLFITHWHTYMSILQRRLHGMCATCTVMYYTLTYLYFYVHPTKMCARYVCCYLLHTDILICPSNKDVCTVCVLHVLLCITH